MRTYIQALLVLSLQTAATAAQEIPLGHPDFYPSAERPVGWRGDGSGYFPGASVVPHFADGTVELTEAPTPHHKKRKTGKFLVANAPDTAKNIVWKYRLPSFTHAQPIIVGKRAIQTCDPHTVICIDMTNGNLLWQTDIDPLLLTGLSGEKLEQARLHQDLAWTLHALAKSMVGNYTVIKVPTPESIAYMKEKVALMKAINAYGMTHFQDIAAANADMLDRADAMLANPGKTWDTNNKDGKTGGKLPGILISIHRAYAKLFMKTYGFPATVHWYSWVGWSWPTPVSDGRYLYTFFSQKQVAAIDLVDGSLRWTTSIDSDARYKQPAPRSPLLTKEAVIIPWTNELFAYNRKDGSLRWRQKIGLHDISAVNPILFSLPTSGKRVIAGIGATRDSAIDILDADSGERLYRHPTGAKGAHNPGSSLMISGDLLAVPYQGVVYQITEQNNTINLKQLWKRKQHGGGATVLAENALFDGRSKVDLETGKPIFDKVRIAIGGWKPGIIVGDTIVGCKMQTGDGGNPAVEVEPGRWVQPCSFPVHSMTGKLLGGKNVLQWEASGEVFDCAPQARRFFKSTPLRAVDCWDINAGVPPNFSYGGLFAQGNRMLIPSLQHLYCIGNPDEAYACTTLDPPAE